MADKSEQKSVNDIASVSPNTSRSFYEALREDGGFSIGTPLQDILAQALGIPSTSKTIQELLFLNLKDELGLVDPYTQYSEQYMINEAELGGLSITEILGNTLGTSWVLLETGDNILYEDGTDKMLRE